ncbi:glutaredoxin domain-containing protein [Sporosarcina sp. FSL W8-0480]|uniref:glutaredoxin family protein n=1 Tax=Sporosarcina sp. FSL W8-0480 TaxID=2954701 RepID=UPI0030D716D9
MTNVATVYSTTTCPYCTMMKNYLTEQNIEFEEVLLTTDEEKQKLVEETGQRGVPQTKLNGKWILGFNPEAVQEALEG